MSWSVQDKDKGLVTNYGKGGGSKREGGHAKFYPYKKCVCGKGLAMLKKEHKTFWGSFYEVA